MNLHLIALVGIFVGVAVTAFAADNAALRRERPCRSAFWTTMEIYCRKPMILKVVKSDADWKKQLTAEQYKIARAKGTEPAFCGLLLDQKKAGVYYCVCCNLPLFASIPNSIPGPAGRVFSRQSRRKMW